LQCPDQLNKLIPRDLYPSNAEGEKATRDCAEASATDNSRLCDKEGNYNLQINNEDSKIMAAACEERADGDALATCAKDDKDHTEFSALTSSIAVDPEPLPRSFEGLAGLADLLGKSRERFKMDGGKDAMFQYKVRCLLWWRECKSGAVHVS